MLIGGHLPNGARTTLVRPGGHTRRACTVDSSRAEGLTSEPTVDHTTVVPLNPRSTTMSLYDLHNAKLNEMEGEGFAYSQKTVYGKSYKGVFFGEDEEEIENLADEEEDATFEGILYDRSREREKSFSVEITDVISTPSGERADFVATEKP